MFRPLSAAQRNRSHPNRRLSFEILGSREPMAADLGEIAYGPCPVVDEAVESSHSECNTSDVAIDHSAVAEALVALFPDVATPRSDIDGNGVLDPQDVLWAIHYFNRSADGVVPADADLKKLDLNGDNQFDPADVLIVVFNYNRTTIGRSRRLTSMAANDPQTAEGLGLTPNPPADRTFSGGLTTQRRISLW